MPPAGFCRWTRRRPRRRSRRRRRPDRRRPSAPANSRDECRDFGEAVLLPGLVNAHTHLEYTALRGFLEDVPFFPWIRALTAAKASLDADDWLWSARLGALESVAVGVTTVGDNTDAGVTMRVLAEAGLRGIVYQELFGIDDREPVEPIMEDLRVKIEAHRRLANDRVGVGVSPHALYTIRPALFAALKAYVAAERLPTSIHVAESPAESLLTERGEGAFAEMYARRGITWDTPHQTPTRYAFTQGADPDHSGRPLRPPNADDTALLAASGAAVIHCPKSNAKLGAGIAPLACWLRTEGLRVGLGTDSAVSNNTLDLWEEMRFALLLAAGLGGRRRGRDRAGRAPHGDAGGCRGDGSGASDWIADPRQAGRLDRRPAGRPPCRSRHGPLRCFGLRGQSRRCDPDGL